MSIKWFWCSTTLNILGCNGLLSTLGRLWPSLRTQLEQSILESCSPMWRSALTLNLRLLIDVVCWRSQEFYSGRFIPVYIGFDILLRRKDMKFVVCFPDCVYSGAKYTTASTDVKSVTANVDLMLFVTLEWEPCEFTYLKPNSLVPKKLLVVTLGYTVARSSVVKLDIGKAALIPECKRINVIMKLILCMIF